MIKCISCGKEIDENDEVCRWCGVVQSKEPNNTNNNKYRKLIIIAIVLVAVIVLAIVISSHNKGKDLLISNGTVKDSIITDEKNESSTKLEKLVINSIGDIENLDDILNIVKDYYFGIDGIKRDSKERIAEEGISWLLVKNYKSLDEIKNHLLSYCTEEMTNNILAGYATPYAPSDYLEKDGKLYWVENIQYAKYQLHPETTVLVDSFLGDTYLIKTTITVDGVNNDFYMGLKIVDNTIKLNVVENDTRDVDKLNCVFPVYTALYNYRLYFEYHNFFEFIEDDSDVYNDDEMRRIYTELKGFSSVKDIENYLLGYFSKRAVDASGYFADNNCFAEKNGKAYCSDAINHYLAYEGTAYDPNTYPTIQYDSISIESISEDKSVIKVRSCIDGSEETWISTFIYENGGYKLDAVQYIFGNNIY